MSDRICIIGASGFGREVMDVATIQGYRQFAFLEVHEGQDPIEGSPVWLDTPERVAELSADGWHFAIGVGTPQHRKKIAERMPNCVFPALIHPDSSFGRNQAEAARAVPGLFVAAGVRMTNNIRLGRHTLFNLNVTVGHDTVVDDYAAMMPGVNISGNVHLGEGCYIGTGASVINGDNEVKLSVGAFSTVGAGAVVVREVPPGTTAVGVPAKVLAAR